MDFDRLNSITKYPSIPTYHAMGERGRLQEPAAEVPTSELIITEKIDGTNARIILAPDGDIFIGSREHLLWAEGDRIINPEMQIVPTVVQLLAHESNRPEDMWTVVYGEVYGPPIGRAGRNYLQEGTSFRAFDAMTMSIDMMDAWMQEPREKIAAWREARHQPFLRYDAFLGLMDRLNLQAAPRILCPGRLPTDIADTAEWLRRIAPTTKLSQTGKPAEGVVVRNQSRSFIVKLRHEDYRRTLRTQHA